VSSHKEPLPLTEEQKDIYIPMLLDPKTGEISTQALQAVRDADLRNNGILVDQQESSVNPVTVASGTAATSISGYLAYVIYAGVSMSNPVLAGLLAITAVAGATTVVSSLW
jgi:hypothetical protein